MARTGRSISASPLVFFDAIRVKVRDEGFVRNKAIYIALGDPADGTKEISGIWIEQTEGATSAARRERAEDPRGPGHSHRGRRWPGRAFPRPLMPFSHRPSFKLASSTSSATRWILPPGRIARAWRRRCGPSTARPTLQLARPPSTPSRKARGRKISGYRAELASQLGARDSVLRSSARRAADHLHHECYRGVEPGSRRAIRTRGHLLHDDAATKRLYLVFNNAAAEWTRPPREWAEAKTQFAVMFNERFVNS